MPQTPLTTVHIQQLGNSLASGAIAAEVVAIVAAKAGTLSVPAMTAIRNLVAHPPTAGRIIAIINAATGTLTPADRKALIIGAGNYPIGVAFANAIDGV